MVFPVAPADRVVPPAYPLEACRYRPPGSPVGSVGLRRQGTSS
jgi:hypothetical protein